LAVALSLQSKCNRIFRPPDHGATEHYDSDATALTHVTVCRIPAEVIHQLSQHSPRMHASLLNKWQKTLREADDWLFRILDETGLVSTKS
jgi:CRP-like cAMP-binding protein